MIRKVGIEDIPTIRSMAEIVFRDTYKDILSPSQMEYMMDWMYSEESLKRQILKEGHTYYINFGDNGEPRGYVSFRPDGNTPEGLPLYHLEKIYVLPAHQAKGLGRELFAKIIEEISGNHDHFRLELNVNRSNPAVTFYEHLGMHISRSGDFPIGRGFFMNDHIMSIDI